MIKNKSLILFIFLTFILYFLFFKNLFSSQFNFWNSDATIKMFPVRVYLYEKLSNFEFPFWTERVFLGYPLYIDIENGILNPINLIFIFLFGPVWSLKLLHFGTYLIGSICLYLLIKKIYPTSNLIGSLLSVLAFYFSFFQINHLIHMNMVLVAMLLPISIFLSQEYFDTKKKRFLILQIFVFTYGILWGQPQINFFNLVVTFIYSFYLNYKFSFKYFLLVLVSSLCLSFIQLYPSFSSFIDTERSGGQFKYWEYTNSPTMFINYVFPYSLGYYQNYQGPEVSGAYSIVETYGYVGISFFVIFIFYLLYGNKDRSFKFVITTFYFYLFITFLGNFFEVKLPIYNDFRYWTRGIFFISFLFLFPLNLLFTNKLSDLKINFKHFFIILAIFFVTYFFESKEFINYLIANKFIYLKKIDVLIWIVLLASTISSIIFYLKNVITLKIFSICILFISLFDLRYYSDDLLPMRISRYKSESSFKTPVGCEATRCLLENQSYNGYEFLMFKTYSPFGYSVFIDKNYVDFFESNFQADLYFSNRSEKFRENLNKDFLQELGFQKVTLANGNYYSFSENKIWILRNEPSGKFIRNEEGIYEFELTSSEDRFVDLNLKYNPNFNVLVNNKKSDLLENGIFSKIKVEKGKNNVQINYFPLDVLKGALIGILCLVIFILILKLIKFRVFN